VWCECRIIIKAPRAVNAKRKPKNKTKSEAKARGSIKEKYEDELSEKRERGKRSRDKKRWASRARREDES
jgi:hypothetical protein